MGKPYKAVFIVGPGLRKTTPELAFNKLLSLYSREGYLLIGDGERKLTRADYNKLKGKIDNTTRIDIFAHGIKHENSHYILLDVHEKTKDFLSLLTKKANGSPLQIHLWSCFGGFAKPDSIELEDGSVFVIHASEKVTANSLSVFSLSKAIESLQLHEVALSPYQQFLDNLPLTLSESFSIIVDDEVTYFKANYNLAKLLENPKKEIDVLIQKFKKFYEKNQIALGADTKGLVLPSISDEQYEEIQFCVLLSRLALGDFNIKEIEQSVNAMKTFNYIVNKNFIDVTLLIVASENGFVETVKLLLEHGVDPDQVVNKGVTPLFISSQGGHKAVVELLLKHKADPDKVNDYGSSPLTAAYNQGHKAVLELLLKYGANPDKSSINGSSLLSLASRYGDEVVVELLLKYRADLDKVDDKGNALLGASLFEHKTVVELLLKCNVNIKTKISGFTVEELLISSKHYDIAGLIHDFANGAIKYAPEECPFHPNYVGNHHAAEILVSGDLVD